MLNTIAKYAKILRGHFSKKENVTPIKIELIPVLEVIFYHEDLPSPTQTPFGEHPEVWDNFYEKQHLLAGLKSKLSAYSMGIPFYELSSISDDNLAAILVKEIEDMEEADFDSDEAYIFQGGYVLRVNDEDIFFPQCCSSLGYITEWQDLLTDEPTCFYQGHPSPFVTKQGSKLIFDFNEELHGEVFHPPVKTNTIILDRQTLKAAIELAIQKANTFSDRVQRINIEQKLEIKNIDKAFFIRS